MSNLIGTYKYASTEIKGYSLSSIAKGEKNDCFVRAIASATDTNYDTAHSFVKEKFGRPNGKGTPGINIATQMLNFEEAGMSLNNKEYGITVLGKDEITNAYKLHGDIIKRKKTVKSFIKSYPKGTFIVGVAKHAFTVKDGVLIDNAGEEFRPTRKVDSAYRVVSKSSPTETQLTLF